MQDTMYDRMLSLPLFQGLGRADLTRILESTRMDFQAVEAGTVIMRQDDSCTSVVFIIDGEVDATTISADRNWSVMERLTPSTVMGLESLYGISRTYSYTAVTATPARLLRVDKRTIAALIGYFEVFRINVLNLLSSTIARHHKLYWRPACKSLENHIEHFMQQHVIRPAGRKVFNITLRILGEYLGEDSRYISKALHDMQQRGLIILGRRNIEVPAFERLIKETL